MPVESRGTGPPAILLLSPAGHRDERDVAQVLVFAYATRHLEPVETRHAEIEKDDGRPEFAKRGERREAVVDDAHVRAEHLEQRAQTIGGVAVVVDDEDTPFGTN